jgi:hypothetical protein
MIKLFEISDEFNFEGSESLLERLDDSTWIYNTIKQSTDEYFKHNAQWNPVEFYTFILNDVISNPEFTQIYQIFKGIAPISNIDIIGDGNDYVQSASVKFVENKNLLSRLRLNQSYKQMIFTLMVSSKYPSDRKRLIADLDSIIGHEINHMMQRVNMIRDGHQPPGDLKILLSKVVNKDAEKSYNNTLSYMDSRRQERDIAGYFLRKNEFDSYAYSIGIWLVHQYGDYAALALNEIMPKIWSEPSTDSVQFNNIDLYPKTLRLLGAYAISLKNAEFKYQLRGNKSARQLWKKLTKEISRYILNRNAR